MKQAREKVAHMIQKIINKSSKINPKSMEIEAWTGLGGSRGRPWEPFGLPRPSGTEKRNQMTKKWPRLGSHFGVHVRHCPLLFDVFLRSFSSLHFDGYQDRFFMDFDQFFGSCPEVWFHKFPDCRQIRKMSFWYSIYHDLSTSASWQIRENQRF